MKAANYLRISAPALFAAALDHRLQRTFGLWDHDIHVDNRTDPRSICLSLELIDPAAALVKHPAALPLLEVLVKAISESTSSCTLPVELCATLVSLPDPTPPKKRYESHPDARRIAGVKFLQSVVAYAISWSSTEPHWGMSDSPTRVHRRGVIL